MIILGNKREEEAVTLYTFDQSRGSTLGPWISIRPANSRTNLRLSLQMMIYQEKERKDCLVQPENFHHVTLPRFQT